MKADKISIRTGGLFVPICIEINDEVALIPKLEILTTWDKIEAWLVEELTSLNVSAEVIPQCVNKALIDLEKSGVLGIVKQP